MASKPAVIVGERVLTLIRENIPFRSLPCGCPLCRCPCCGQWTALADVGACRFGGLGDPRHQRLIEEFTEAEAR